MNSVEVGSSATAFGTNDQNVLRIGGGATEGDGNYFFQGDVDDPAIYNRALTPEQIIGVSPDTAAFFCRGSLPHLSPLQEKPHARFAGFWRAMNHEMF